MTNTTADTSIMINMCLSCFLVEMYSSFRAVHIAASGHTTTAQITYFVINLYTRRACFIYNTQNIFFKFVSTIQCLTGIFR